MKTKRASVALTESIQRIVSSNLTAAPDGRKKRPGIVQRCFNVVRIGPASKNAADPGNFAAKCRIFPQR